MSSKLSRRRALASMPALAAAGFLGTPGAVADAGRPIREDAGRARPRLFPVLRPGRPEQVGMNGTALRGVDEAIGAGLGPGPEATFPGAVVLIAKDGVVVKHSAYGHAQTFDGQRPVRRPMRTDTIFDLASVTKVTATTVVVMHLLDAGQLRLGDPVYRWLPAFGAGDKAAITIRHLLTHTAGLWEWQPTYLHATNPRGAIRYICGLPLRYPVGAERHYSDFSFILLGEIVRRLTRGPLPAYLRAHIHGPLGMTDTGYLPKTRHPKRRIAATSLGNAYEQQMISSGEPYPILGGAGVDDYRHWPRHTLLGEVNDGNCGFALHGVSGHAGLFSTAGDLAVYCQMLLNGGGYGRRRLLDAATVDAFTTEQLPGQALGFWTDRFADVPSLRTGGFGSNPMGSNGIGHSGFTGTEFTVDPDRGLVLIMLTNRCHPNLPYASVQTAWTGVCDAVGQSLTQAEP